MAENKEANQKGILLFTVAFDVEKNAISFVGNMPVAQASAITQTIFQQQQREQVRKEIEAELSEKAKREKEPKR